MPQNITVYIEFPAFWSWIIPQQTHYNTFRLEILQCSLVPCLDAQLRYKVRVHFISVDYTSADLKMILYKLIFANKYINKFSTGGEEEGKKAITFI